MAMSNRELFALMYNKVFEIANNYKSDCIYDEKVKEEVARQFGKKKLIGSIILGKRFEGCGSLLF
ncbi:hypothetical protein [Clostridium kluyveri]|uniref:Uncharacterized protein n=1 Tax=Clostridium kluyveri TaxID=1534 RepID=A0A1L5FC25_CLOKL|nr:hypothetical protein [Clostridium kluyveri]APM40527.1 hypothetical protein BS101_18245 [Clostridium kluyveri]